jgi:CheY-like chemotaxis protein
MRARAGAPKILNVLLAEDDPNDLKLVTLALARQSVPARFFTVNDGEEVLSYLKGEGTFADRSAFPVPDLLVLDLKMPRLDGFEVVKWVRQNHRCIRLPIVMLSGSGLDEDVEEAYRLGVNSYFRKPSSITALTTLLRTLATYWQLTERPSLQEHTAVATASPLTAQLKSP